jgi:hypothetical protein
MKQLSWWTLILVVVAGLSLVGATRSAKTSPKTTWEYKVISTYGPSAATLPNINQLNDEGVNGWELIAIRSGRFPEENSKQIRTDYYFKR